MHARSVIVSPQPWQSAPGAALLRGCPGPAPWHGRGGGQRCCASAGAPAPSRDLPVAGQGKAEEADQLFERVIAIRVERVGPDHPDLANEYHNLGRRKMENVRQPWQRCHVHDLRTIARDCT